LEYGNVAWHPYLKKDITMLEKVQRRAIRLIPEIRSKSYQERLPSLDLPSLVYRRLRGDAIECYKYLQGYYNTDTELLVRYKQSGVETRGHSLKLQKDRCKTRIRSNFFSQRVINMWNSLPTEVVGAPSLNSFKGRLDKHWFSMKYSTEACSWAAGAVNRSS
jgi:ribonucleases P/MRP protein subunit RPP40